MKGFNAGQLISGLQNIITAVGEIAPLAEKLGGPIVANVATIAIAATATIENALERGQQLKGALSEQDETKLRAMLSDLQQANDGLASAISEGTGAEAPQGGSDGPTGEGEGS